MAQATIVSICPFETREEKPIARGLFIIPAAEKDSFVLVHIADSSYIQRLTATDRNIQIPVAADLIAKSIIDDFINTTIESSDDAGPGMMWFEGRLTRSDVIVNYAEQLATMKKKQTKWFENLCRKGDDDWNQYRQIGLISDHQRYAARYLGYHPDWLVEYNQNEGMTDCPACFSQIDSRAVKCLHCGAILDKVAAAAFGIFVPAEPVIVKPTVATKG